MTTHQDTKKLRISVLARIYIPNTWGQPLLKIYLLNHITIFYFLMIPFENHFPVVDEVKMMNKLRQKAKSCSTMMMVFPVCKILFKIPITFPFSLGATPAVGSSKRNNFISCRYNLPISKSLIWPPDKLPAFSCFLSYRSNSWRIFSIFSLISRGRRERGISFWLHVKVLTKARARFW